MRPVQLDGFWRLGVSRRQASGSDCHAFPEIHLAIRSGRFGGADSAGCTYRGRLRKREAGLVDFELTVDLTYADNSSVFTYPDGYYGKDAANIRGTLSCLVTDTAAEIEGELRLGSWVISVSGVRVMTDEGISRPPRSGFVGAF